MKASELRGKTTSELHGTLQGLYEEHVKLRMKLSGGNFGKHRQLRDNKKAIARVKTVLAEQES